MGNLTLQGSTSGQITLQPTAVAGTNTITLPASTGTVMLTSGGTATGLTLAAGTATVPPLKFTTGVNLTTPVAGALEYTSPTIFGTPTGTERGLIATAQYYELNSSRTGPTTTSTFSIFGVGCSLSASTRYAYEIYFTATKSSANAAAIQYALATTTGSLASHSYTVISNTAASAATPAASNAMSNYITSAFSTLVTIGPTSAAAGSSHVQLIKGVIETSTAVTGLNPNFAFSATPTTSSIAAGAYMLIYPISTTTGATNIGTWA